MRVTARQLQNLAEAQRFYERRGYRNVDVPWIVDPRVDDELRPKDRNPLVIPHSGHLPGSGEEGLVQLALDGWLRAGKYQTITPCWRLEPKFDETHLPYFLKLELIKIGDNDYRELCDAAQEFMSLDVKVRSVASADGVGRDLEDLRGMELGSYGFRAAAGVVWSYGTGLAEPRYSMAQERDSRERR